MHLIWWIFIGYIRNSDIRPNKIYSSVQFKTLAYLCLTYYYNLFYKEKIYINISEFLIARALVYWICDHGSLNYFNQTNLCTLAYYYEDLIKLSEALNLLFNKWGIIISIKQ